MPEQAKEIYRSFTVRVPLSLYTQMAEQARAEKMHLNGKANQLLRLGLGEKINLDAALAALIREKLGSGEA
jgi:hypothetical protein